MNSKNNGLFKNSALIALTMLLVFSFIACTKEGNVLEEPAGQLTEPTKAEATKAPTLTDEPAATATPIVTEEVTPEPTATFEPPAEPVAVDDGRVKNIRVGFEQVYDSEWDYDNNEVLFYYQEDYPVLDEKDAVKYPELAEAFDEFQKAAYASAKSVLSNLRECADVDKGEEYYYGPYFNSTKMLAVRTDSNLICLESNYETYSGGIHGIYGTWGYCYDPSTGKTLAITDFIVDRNAFVEYVYNDLMTRNDEDDYLLYDDMRQCVENYFDENRLCFTVGYTGLTVVFNPYEILPYAMGQTFIDIPFKGNETMFNSKYLDVPDNYMIPMNGNYTIRNDFGNDGYIDTITVYKNYFNEMEEFNSLSFYLNELPVSKEFNTPETCYDTDIYYIHCNGEDLLYIDYWFASEDDLTYVYKINMNSDGYEENAEENPYGTIDLVTDEMYMSFSGNYTYDPMNAVMYYRYDMIGTNFLKAHYAIGKDYLPVQLDLLPEFSYYFNLTARQDIPMLKVNMEDTSSKPAVEVPYTVKSGSNLRMFRTDGKSFIDFLTEEGDDFAVRMYIEELREEYPDLDYVFYDYVPLGYESFDELFDNIIYAD